MESLPDGLVASLEQPGAYPGDPSGAAGIDRIQTHISWVFLTRDRVYKLRKAVELPFLSFATREQRNADCAHELRLNRRLAPDVYLGLAPILRTETTEASEIGWRLGDPSEALAEPDSTGDVPEHCVVMRRLAEPYNALTMLEADRLRPAHLASTARLLVDFHRGGSLGVPAPFSRAQWLEHVWSPLADAIDLASSHLPSADAQARIEALRRDAKARFDGAREALDARRLAGRIADGHGDLHLAHLWFEDDDGPPRIIDCIEFREDFRHADVASEVAFLAMDLRYRKRADLAEHFLREYARDADDFGLYAVLDLFVAYRAVVRGAVAAVASSEPEIPPQQREGAARSADAHLALATATLVEPPRGDVIAVCGTVGSGKSTVAREAAELARGVVVPSDWIRKSIAGLGPTDRGAAHPELDIYAEGFTDRVYAGLLERAAPVVASGRTAVIDATFAKARHRTALLDWCRERGSRVLLLEARCAEPEALRRLRERQQLGTDASDAGPDFLRASLEAYDPPDRGPDAWPDSARVAIQTDRKDWRAGLAEALKARLRPAACS